MIHINNEYFNGVVNLAKTEEEKQMLLTFINDENNNDFLEYTYLYSNQCYGFYTLSSGKTVYTSPPLASPEVIGSAMKVFAQRFKEKENDEEFWNSLTVDFISEKLEQISDEWGNLTNQEPKELTIEQLKKQIKYSKNPLELKMLNKKLNKVYKERN